MKKAIKQHARTLCFLAVVAVLGAAWMYAAAERNDASDETQRMRNADASAEAKATKARNLRESGQ